MKLGFSSQAHFGQSGSTSLKLNASPHEKLCGCARCNTDSSLKMNRSVRFGATDALPGFDPEEEKIRAHQELRRLDLNFNGSNKRSGTLKPVERDIRNTSKALGVVLTEISKRFSPVEPAGGDEMALRRTFEILKTNLDTAYARRTRLYEQYNTARQGFLDFLSRNFSNDLDMLLPLTQAQTTLIQTLKFARAEQTKIPGAFQRSYEALSHPIEAE